MKTIETEIKVPCPDHDAILERFVREGFTATVLQPRHFEDNRLFDTADGVLRTNRSALRIRSAEGRTIVTFKGKPTDAAIVEGFKIREELECEASDATVMAAILERLGYRPFFRYQKFRTTFRLEHPEIDGELKAMLDETPLGGFLELEGTKPAIDWAAARLGLALSEATAASYIKLQAEHCAALGRPLEDMVFPDGPTE